MAAWLTGQRLMIRESLQTNPVAASFAIRRFETALLDLHKRGLISGTVHTCVGQEAIAVALHAHLKVGRDAFFASHRGHGHFLAYGGAPEALLAEMMGREGAVCLGRGGSQHLCHGRFFSNGIQAAGCLQAVGFAWAQKLRGEDTVTIAQLGDGTLGEGGVYEAMNIAALLKVPVLFLIEYNGWAQSTDVRTTIAGTIEGRASAFGLPCDRGDDVDVAALSCQMDRVIETVRGGQPFVQIIETRRLLAHSKGDDNRLPELIAAQFDADPLKKWIDRNPLESDILGSRVNLWLDNCISEVISRPTIIDVGETALPDLAHPPDSATLVARRMGRNAYGTIVQELNRTLHLAMGEDDRVVMLGEDIADPYGGAFKVTQGLSTSFGRRVFSTPIAENAIAGLATGAALAGLRPVAEVMFADFVTLAVDQLINSAAKFYYMFGGKVTCPLTLRLVSGGGRGYGPTHSQSTERLLCGEPGLRVVALSRRHDPATLLAHVILEDDAPTIFVENKALYAQKPITEAPLAMHFRPVPGTGKSYPPLVFEPQDQQAAVTVVSYGNAAQLVEEALAQLLMEHEEYGELIILTQIWPLDVSVILNSAKRTKRLLVVEPHVAAYGVCAAVISAVAEQSDAKFAFCSVGAHQFPIPSSRQLEDSVLPSVDAVGRALRQILRLS